MGNLIRSKLRNDGPLIILMLPRNRSMNFYEHFSTYQWCLVASLGRTGLPILFKSVLFNTAVRMVVF